jgi:type I site-specific restriction endonuclease
MPTEADTCRQFVVPKLQAAGWETDVHPVYTYSLRQGIADGFLAHYRVHGIVTRRDATGWRPSKGELDRNVRPVQDDESLGSLLKSACENLRKDKGLNGGQI